MVYIFLLYQPFINPLLQHSNAPVLQLSAFSQFPIPISLRGRFQPVGFWALGLQAGFRLVEPTARREGRPLWSLRLPARRAYSSERPEAAFQTPSSFVPRPSSDVIPSPIIPPSVFPRPHSAFVILYSPASDAQTTRGLPNRPIIPPVYSE
jgi:hypothetical protein